MLKLDDVRSITGPMIVTRAEGQTILVQTSVGDQWCFDLESRLGVMLPEGLFDKVTYPIERGRR